MAAVIAYLKGHQGAGVEERGGGGGIVVDLGLLPQSTTGQHQPHQQSEEEVRRLALGMRHAYDAFFFNIEGPMSRREPIQVEILEAWTDQVVNEYVFFSVLINYSKNFKNYVNGS
jgi:hypothetical protein